MTQYTNIPVLANMNISNYFKVNIQNVYKEGNLLRFKMKFVRFKKIMTGKKMYIYKNLIRKIKSLI